MLMIEERLISSWLLKPCSDGISIDVRPPKRYQLNLSKMKESSLKNYKVEIKTPSISILFNEDNIKLTLYQSGRMLIESRDMEKAEKIVREILNYFKFAL